MRIAATAALALCFALASSPILAVCDPTTEPDRSDVANARAAIEANCDCAGAATHGEYVRCAVQHVTATLQNPSCRGTVARCAARSTCGKPGFVTCCQTKSTGLTKCSVKRDAARCRPPRNGSACVGVFPSCCDACTASGCATSTTTSTTTSSTTGTTTPGTTTTTTLPPVDCGNSTYPACGGDCGVDSVCIPGRINCLDFPANSGTGCFCVSSEVAAAPCACGPTGTACPPQQVCQLSGGCLTNQCTQSACVAP